MRVSLRAHGARSNHGRNRFISRPDGNPIASQSSFNKFAHFVVLVGTPPQLKPKVALALFFATGLDFYQVRKNFPEELATVTRRAHETLFTDFTFFVCRNSYASWLPELHESKSSGAKAHRQNAQFRVERHLL